MLDIISDDIITYIQDFLDIKSQVRLANTSKNNYNVVNSYFINLKDENVDIKGKINLSNLFEFLNISCKFCYRYKEQIQNVKHIYIDLVLHHNKKNCSSCIYYKICKECKTYSKSVHELPCDDCLRTYSGRKVRYIGGEWEESDCRGKRVCGFLDFEFKGERCKYKCDFCNIIQNKKNYEQIKINKLGWKRKWKGDIDRYNIYSLKNLSVNVNFIFACSKCFNNLSSEEKKSYENCYLNPYKDSDSDKDEF